MRKVALVTGAGSGIGRALALEFAEKGFDLILVGRRLEALEETRAQAWRLFQAESLPLVCDLSNPQTRAEFCRQLKSVQLGPIMARLHVLIHCAGQFCGGTLTELSDADVQRFVEVNFAAAWSLTQTCQDSLAANQGSVLFIASTVVFLPLPYTALYCATKAALASLAHGLHFELKEKGIHCQVVYPPGTRTPMTAGMAEAAGLAAFPLLEPEAVARKVFKAYTRKRTEVTFGGPERILHWLQFGCPSVVRAVLYSTRNLTRRMVSAHLAKRTSPESLPSAKEHVTL